MLFFAPVVNNDGNVFTLINEIDGIFDEKIIENSSLSDIIKNLAQEQKPSMSYGVSITYYKYPMREAIETARVLLFGKAKKNNSKNAIAYRVLKHSGQYFEDVLGKNGEFYNKLIDMLNKSDTKLMSSIIYNLDLHKKILKAIIDDKNKIDNYFDNFYNEDIHNKNRGVIDKAKNLVLSAYNENFKNFDIALRKVFSGLRLVKFMNRRDYDNE